MTKKNEQLDLFDTINLTHNEYLSAQDEEKHIYEKMEKELAEAERKIKLSYQEKIDTSKNNCLALKRELQNYKKLLEKYSTFDSKMIGNIIEKLVSLIEGEDYSYQEAEHETYEYYQTVFGMESCRTNKKVLLIVKGNDKQGYYYDNGIYNNEVHKLVKSGQAFVLAEDEFNYNKKIKFYRVKEYSIKSLIDFNQFSYVQNFINLVIKYRFEKNLDEITEKELLSIMSEFVLSEKEMIEEKYKKHAIEKQEQLRQQLSEEQLKHDKEMMLIEFEDILNNGVPSKHSNNLIDRLQELSNNNADFSKAMSQFEILYGINRNTESHSAKITFNEPLISSENIFISKIDIEISIKGYFDDSDLDPHFQGECDIDLVDDGLIGIVDISSLRPGVDYIINSSLPQGLYKVDRINDEYLRILYLPNKGEYKHESINVYSWLLSGAFNKNNENSPEKAPSVKSVKIEWNSAEESERMLPYLKEIELLSNLNEEQVKLYKKRKI